VLEWDGRKKGMEREGKKGKIIYTTSSSVLTTYGSHSYVRSQNVRGIIS
jgi:hypothetical protein